MNKSLDDIIYGRHAVVNFIHKAPKQIEKILINQSLTQSKAIQILVREARSRKITVVFSNRQALDRLADGGVHQGVIARISQCKFMDNIELLYDHSDPSLILVLDQIQDPRNIGAIFRSAAASDVRAIVLPQRGMGALSATAMKASCGTLTEIPVMRVANITRTLIDLKKNGYWVIGIDMEAKKRIFEDSYPSKTVLVIGGEDKGIRKLVVSTCDELRNIPMTGPAGSLNVSVATSIVLYEVTRQKLQSRG